MKDSQQKHYHLKITTPEGILVNQSVCSLVANAHEGLLGVLPGHCPLICRLKTGPFKYESPTGQFHHLLMSDGILEVHPQYGVLVLCDHAEAVNE